MKKKLMIILFILMIILSFAYVFYNIHKVNKKNNETQNIERDSYVEKFAKQGKIEKFNGEGNESGYEGVVILNKDKLVKVTTLDEFTKISSVLSSSINNMQEITENKDILTLDYFTKNKLFIEENFGIKNQSEFKRFINSVGYNANKEFKIQKCSIEDASKKDNTVYIDLFINDSKLRVKVNIKSDKSNNVKYDIHYQLSAD